MDKSNTSDTRNVDIGRTRLIIGGILFIGGFLSPLLIPLVTQSDLPGNWKVFLSTGLVAGLPEVGMVLAAAVLGKQGFVLLREKLFSLLRKHTAPAVVSARRYHVGLFMFLTPLALGWLAPYVAHFFHFSPVRLLLRLYCSTCCSHRVSSFSGLNSGKKSEVYLCMAKVPVPGVRQIDIDSLFTGFPNINSGMFRDLTGKTQAEMGQAE